MTVTRAPRGRTSCAIALEELTRFVNEGPSGTELADAQKAYLESQKLTRGTDSAIASQIVGNLNLKRDFARAAELEKKIASLTVDDVKAAWKKHIDPKKLVIIRAGDFKK